MGLFDGGGGLGAAAGLGGLVSGAAAPFLGTFGQMQTNSANNEMNFDNNQTQIQLADQAEGFSAQEIQQQEAFQQQMVNAQEAYQTQMSDTAMTRGVADLKNAGLNPMLAAGNPDSSPTGASMSGGAASGVVPSTQKASFTSPWSSAAAGLNDLAKNVLSVAQTNAQVKNTEANTNLADAQANKTNIDAGISANTKKTGDFESDLMDDVRGAYQKAKESLSSSARDAADWIASKSVQAQDLMTGTPYEPTQPDQTQP